MCSPFRAAHEWRQAELARKALAVVVSDGRPDESCRPEHEELLTCTQPTATT